MPTKSSKGVKRPRSEAPASQVEKFNAFQCAIPSTGRSNAILVSKPDEKASQQVFVLAPQSATEEDMHQIFASAGDIQESEALGIDAGRVVRWRLVFSDAAAAAQASKLPSSRGAKNAAKLEQRQYENVPHVIL